MLASIVNGAGAMRFYEAVLSLKMVCLVLPFFQSNSYVSGLRLSQNSVLGRVVGELTIFQEISKFLVHGREKLETECTTVIWDNEYSTVLDYLKLCGDLQNFQQPCIPIYTVFLEDGGNLTEDTMKTLKEGYRRQCGAYVLILRSSSAVVDLLHLGDDLRLMNIRARFLIWYDKTDKNFEEDDIWKKVPNAVLFQTKLGHRARKRMTFTIKGFKWPILANGQDPTKLLDFWSQGKYFGRSVERWYRDKTNDLKNVTLKILAVEHPPGVIKYESSDGNIEYAGSEVEIVKELSHIMNFDYEFLEVESDTKWGGQISSNSTQQFYGAVARLIYGEADMAIGSFFVLKHYLDFLDMSIPLDVACTSFLVPNPLTRPRYLALILPFNYKLWGLVLSICFIFAPFGLYVLSKLPVHATEYKIFTRRSQVVFTCFSIMSQVALHLWPKFWAVRMFIGWFWMFCLLITLAYRGAMVSFLTIPLFENPIDNINDLMSSGLRIGGWGTELHRLFKLYASTNGQSETKTILKDRYEMIEDVNDGVSWVAAGEFALYENIRFLKFVKQTRNLTKHGSPAMRIMKQCIVPVHIGIAYQKNSPIVPTINRHIRRFQESGLMKRWSQRLVSRTKQHYQQLAEENNMDGFVHHESDANDDDEDENEIESVSGSSNNKQRKQRVLNLRDLQGSIYLICLGFFLSITAFIVEIFVAHSRSAAKNVNKELKKIKDKAKGKGILILDGVNHANGGSSGSSSSAGKAKPPPPFNLTSKDQLLQNMLLEYESLVRRTENQVSTKKGKIDKDSLLRKFTLKKAKTDSVRVRTNDNNEVFFTYMQ